MVKSRLKHKILSFYVIPRQKATYYNTARIFAYNSSWKSPNFTKPVLTLIFLSKQQILNFLSVFSIRKIINLKTLREKSTFHNGAIIIWIKYTGTIQISPEPRLFSISTIYNAFNFIFYPTLSIFYITTIIIFVWGAAHTPCVSGCLLPIWIPPRGILIADRAKGPTVIIFGA